MTSGLRKLHKFSWIFITLIGLVFLFFTIKELNFSTQNYSVNVENNQIKIAMKNANQIEVLVKSSIQSSSSVVYGIKKNGEQGEVLGQISTTGKYIFNTTYPLKGIVIIDEIKKVELSKLMF